MPLPVVYRSFLATIHETAQNTTDPSRNNSTAPTSHSHSHSHLESGLIIALNVLLVILIYLCFYKYFFCRRPIPSNSHHHSTATTATPDSPSSPSSPRSNGDGRALELHLLSSIPVAEFKRIGEEKAECVVCLVEFKDGDELRVLPPCSHRFHVDCVDTWFRSHANCPLCRTLVEENAAAGSESVV